ADMRRIIRRLENMVGVPERLVDVARFLHGDWIALGLREDPGYIDRRPPRTALPRRLNNGQRPVGRLVVIREYRYQIAVSHDANHAWHVLRRRCVNFDETSGKGRSPQDAGEQHSRPKHILRVNSPACHARLCVNSPDIGSHHREVSLLGERYLVVDLPLDRLTIEWL